MKKLVLFLAVLFISNFIYSQQLNSSDLVKLTTIKESIEKKILLLSDSLSVVKSKINEIEKQKVLLKISQFKDSVFVIGTASMEVPLRDASNPEGKTILTIKRGEKLKLFEYLVGKGYWYSSFNSSYGYVSDAFITENDSIRWLKDIFYSRNFNMNKLLEIEKNKLDSIYQIKLKIVEAEREKAKKDALIKKYGAVNGTKIYQQKIWIGMTREMLIESWGDPDKINRTVGSYGVHEQFVYGDTYVYVQNGKLTSWQD